MAGNGVNCRFTVGATKICIYRADITDLKVDVIVNATNEYLEHIGGVAAAIAKAAGSKLVKDCEDIIKNDGTLKISQVVKTKPGKLQCRAIFHAVCPTWDDSTDEEDHAECLALLKRTLENTLTEADRREYRSMALPPISAGTFGVPNKEVAKVMANTIRLAAEKNKWTTLKEIHVVDIKDNVLSRVASLMEESGYINEATDCNAVSSLEIKANVQAGFLIGRLFSVYIYRADITKFKVDAIVNATDKNLKHEGGLARAISEAAGPEFNKECKKMISKEGQVKIADVVKTAAGSMPCKEVLHTVGPIYPFKDTKLQYEGCRTNLILTFVNVLRKADAESFRSIALPPISAGERGMPANEVALSMVEAFRAFVLTTKTPKLKYIHVVDVKDDVLPQVIAMLDQFRLKDTATGQQVSAERINEDDKQPRSDNGFYAAFMLQNLFKLQIYRADITKLKVEVIVNSTSKDFGYKGTVAKAIANVAGPEFVQKCKEIHRELGDMTIAQVVDSMAGNLPCKRVFHTVGPKWMIDQDRRKLNECTDELRRAFENVLAFANDKKFVHIAVPPISTGKYGVPNGDVARAVVEGIKSFALKDRKIQLKDVYVVDDKHDILALVVGLLDIGGYENTQTKQTISVERKTFQMAPTSTQDDERVKPRKQSFVAKLFTGGQT